MDARGLVRLQPSGINIIPMTCSTSTMKTPVVSLSAAAEVTVTAALHGIAQERGYGYGPVGRMTQTGTSPASTSSIRRPPDNDIRRATPVRHTVIAVSLGIALGLAFWGLDNLWVATDSVAQLAAVWVAAAFGVGSIRSKGPIVSVVLGSASLVVGVFVFYLLGNVVRSIVFPPLWGAWVTAALLGGGLSGGLGYLWASGHSQQKVLAVSLLAAAFVGEGAGLAISMRRGSTAVFICESLVGLTLPLLLLRDWRLRLTCYIEICVWAVVAFAGTVALPLFLRLVP